MSLLNIVKKAGVQAVGAGSPVEFLFGRVSKAKPLEIEINPNFILKGEFLVLTESVTRYEVDLEHSHAYTDDGASATTEKALTNLLTKTPIRTGLKKDDKVVLAKVQGGNKYLVLDKVVDA